MTSWKCKPTAAVVAVADCSYCYCCRHRRHRCCCCGDYGGDDEFAAVAADDARCQLRGIAAIVDCQFCWPDFGLIHQRVAAAGGAGGGCVAK